MTLFRNVWRALASALEPRPRSANLVGLHTVFIDTRPFNVDNRSHQGR